MFDVVVAIDDDVDVVSLVVVSTAIGFLLTQTPRVHIPLLKLLPQHC